MGMRIVMKETVIQVKDLSKLYKLYEKPSDRLKESLSITKKEYHKKHYALKHVDFDVKRGECVGIIGTNGSGKSTVLKIITGVLTPTGGSVGINGRISALLELGAGFNMEYTGIENVYLNGTMIGFTKEEIDAKLDGILEFADIGDFVYQPVKTYSSGMLVRLAFAVAINIEPEILIVDEALSVGDVFFQAKCYRKFEEFKKMGKTILLVSHDLGSVAKYCDRVILLNKGEKLAEGKPKEIVDLYKKLLVNALDDPEEAKALVQEGTGEDEGQEPSENEGAAKENNGGGAPAEEKTAGEKSDGIRQDKKSGAWKDHMPKNPKVLEYGQKEAEIIDFAILDENGNFSNNLEKWKEFTVKIKVKFHQVIPDPIMAFTIKDLRGTEIAGTNTMMEDAYIEVKEPGEVHEAAFSQVMSLQGGEYLLSLGVTGFQGNDFKVYHRLYDVCDMHVFSEKNTVGLCDLNSKVKVR